MQLSGSTAVITGGARRVGRHVAARLAERGANVVVNYRTSAREAEEAVAEFRRTGVGALAVRADVSTRQGVESIMAAAIEQFGSVEVLINNASIYGATPFRDLSEEDWDRNLDVNLKGPFLGGWLFGRHMLERGRGKIINVADWGVMRPYVGYLPYFVAKGGVVALTKGLAKELAPHVHVNAVAPGPILMPEDFDAETTRAVEKATPLRRIGNPEDIAQTMLWLIEGTDFVTGAIIPVDGGRQIA